MGGDDEADEASSALSYERDELSSYLAGHRVAPVNYVPEEAEQPVYRVSKRAAQRQLAKHVAVKANLVAFARGHLTTVTDALIPFATQSAPNSAAPSPRPAATFSPVSAGRRPSRLAPWGSSDDEADEGASSAASIRSHPATCTCLACVDRSIRRSVAANDLGSYGDFLAANSERLHRAMGQQAGSGPPSVRSAADSHHAFPPAPWHYLQAPSDDASGYYQVSVSNGRSNGTPTTVGGNGNGHTSGRHQDEADGDSGPETGEDVDDDEDEEHLPRYVLQRYSQLSNLRGKTLSRAVRALAAEVARPAHARAASKPSGPVALHAVADPRVALAVTVAEMGERLPGGKRRPLSARLAEGLRDVLDGARQQRAGRAADPDDDSDEQEEGARTAARRRAHAAVLQEVRSASGMGAGGQGVSSSKGSGRGHEVAGAGSALATRMSTAGAAVPKPGAAKVVRSPMGGLKAGGAGKEEGYAARAALSDSSEDEFSRRVTDAGPGMAQQRQRVTEAMSHTLRGLGVAPPVRVPPVVVEDSDEDQGQHEHMTARAPSTARSQALRLSRSAAATPRSAGRHATSSTGGSAVGTGSSGWFLTRELKGGSDGSSGEDVRRAAGGRDVAHRGQQEALADAWEERASRALSLGGVLVRRATTSPRMQKTAGVAGVAAAAQSPLQQHQEGSMAGGKSSRGGVARQLKFAGDASSSSAASTAVYGNDVTPAADAAQRRSEVAAAQTRALRLGPEALSYDEVRLLSGAGAVHSTPGSPGAAVRAAMRATWAPVSGEDYARMALALGHMGSLTARISAPPDRPPSARGGQGAGGGRGVVAACSQGDVGKGQWAQRAFGHVSGGGGD